MSARCPCEGGFCTDPACDWPGRGDRIALIGCSAQKLARPAPARELYTGALFRFSVAYAEKRGLRWVVLSAKHGVVLPDDVIEPYDMTLARWTPPQVMKWGIGVGGDLERSDERLRELDRLACASRDYGDVEAWAREARRQGDPDPLRLLRSLRAIVVLSARQERLRRIHDDYEFRGGPRSSGRARLDRRALERLVAELRRAGRLLARNDIGDPMKALLRHDVRLSNAQGAALAHTRDEKNDRESMRRYRRVWADSVPRLILGGHGEVLPWRCPQCDHPAHAGRVCHQEFGPQGALLCTCGAR